MAEQEVEAAWREEFKRIGETPLSETLNSGAGFADELQRRQHFVGRVTKPKPGGSRKSKLTTMCGGASLSP